MKSAHKQTLLAAAIVCALAFISTVARATDTFGVGMDTGSPVSNTYKPPLPFTGTIAEVRIELK